MDVHLADLRDLVSSDQELADICVEVLTVLAFSERVAETLEFNQVDVTVDRQLGVITFQGVLSIEDQPVRLAEKRFITLTSAIAEPLSGDRLAQWRKGHERPAWPMPATSD